jgi:hypothetical protein
MMGQAFLSLATAFGLATAAGLNAYIPLFIVALLSRVSSLVTLSEPYDALSSWWVIGALGVLMVIEILVDKVPAADTVNDVIHTFIRPAAGALLFAASTKVIGLHPVLAALCGVILAGGVHAAKSTGRPVVTATTAGVGNPIVSTVEDVISFVTSVIALLAPYVAAVLIIVGLLLIVWWAERRRRRRSRRISGE